MKNLGSDTMLDIMGGEEERREKEKNSLDCHYNNVNIIQ